MSGRPVLFNRLRARGSVAVRPAATLPIPDRVEVAVVGGGIIGLAIGWRLAARGLSVAIFEAEGAGSGTSAAATGMLAAAAELEPGGEKLLALALESQALWPDFRDAAEAASRQSIDYRRDGTLVVAIGRDEVERLRFRHDLQRRSGLATRWLSGAETRTLEPALASSATGAILCSDDHQIDPNRLIDALAAAFRHCGGRLFEDTAVEGLDQTNGRVTGIVAADRLCRATTTILATGPVVGQTDWLPAGVRVPVRPLKGQSLVLEARRGPLPIEHVVWTSEIHLAPKTDGRLILGATMEESGFDPDITAGGVFALLEAARRILPGIEEMAIESLRSGFRPTSDDDAPILGPTPLDGLVIAAGHHRNGYLLAPVTARAIEDLVLDGRIKGAAAQFGLERFGVASDHVLAMGET